MEDIIVLGGGNLIMELRNRRPGGLADAPVSLVVDGVEHRLRPSEPIRLMPGQSEPGTGTVLSRGGLADQ